MEENQQGAEQVQLNPREQAIANKLFAEKITDIIMPWSPDLKAWHPFAVKALNHANVVDLQVSTKSYRKLGSSTQAGINCNVCAVLSNNLEKRTPSEMGVDYDRWKDILVLNDRLGDVWNGLTSEARQAAIQETVAQRTKIVKAPVKKIITAEA